MKFGMGADIGSQVFLETPNSPRERGIGLVGVGMAFNIKLKAAGMASEVARS